MGDTCTFCGQPDITEPGGEAGWDRHGSVAETDERMCKRCQRLAESRIDRLQAMRREVICDCQRCRSYSDMADEDIPADWDPDACWDRYAAECAGPEGRKILKALEAAIETVRWDSEIFELCRMHEERQLWYVACAEMEGRATAAGG